VGPSIDPAQPRDAGPGVARFGAGLLRVVAAASGVYDLLIGIALVAGRAWLMRLFDLPAPVPPIHADLNALFAIAVGLGYALPLRDPVRYRAYLWLMGPGLKGAGALLFLADHVLRGSPPAFLVFALGDGTMAGLTLWALWRTRRR
jgi:hypothetical protein